MEELSPERWRRIEELIDGALDLPDAERDAFLRSACDDDALRAEVLALIEAGERPRILPDSPAAMFASDLIARADTNSPPPYTAPERVGPYRIVRQLGQGGMGTVYLGERDAHFEQRVALKLIRRGLHLDEEIVRRFVDERKILASLDHPGIARLLDGGLADDGLPWFAMELVEGEPVTAFCDARQLSVDARLELFCAVCDAVGYAHERSVVHRDLKPTNILARADGAVKLLDFGIAKLLAPDLEDPQYLTRTGGRVLTPAYASPEQIRGQPVTPASDVYSLGVLLYELLAGRSPYRVTSSNSTPHDLERAVVEDEPTRPSLALQGEQASTRGTTADALSERLRGPLDRIVLQALAKDPQRRYPSANALADDVRRHLQGLPVRARHRRPPRRWMAMAIGAGVAIVAGAAVMLPLVRSSSTPSRPNEETVSAGPVFAVGLIADYRSPGAADVARPLADLLATNLARVPSLRMISTARLYELMAQTGARGFNDAGSYSAAAKLAGATELVDGSLFATDDGALRLDLRRIELATGNVRATRTVTGRSLFALVDSGTAGIAADIGSRGPQSSVADITTRSEVAYRFYEEGLRAYYRGDTPAAHALFETAVAEDSTFAMALYRLATATTDPGRSHAHMERAVRAAARTSDRERLIIETAYAILFSDPAATAKADTLSQRYPEDLSGPLFFGQALYAAADYAGALGRYRGIAAANSVSPNSATARCTACEARAALVDVLIAMDSLGAADREATRWTELEPTRTVPWLVLANVKAMREQHDAGQDAYVRATAIDPALQGRPAYYAYHVMRRGDYEAADRALREIVRIGAPVNQSQAYWFLAISLREQGKFAEALRAARSYRVMHTRLNPDSPPYQFRFQEAQALFEDRQYLTSVALFDSIAAGWAEWPPAFQARYRTWTLGLAANPLVASGDTALLSTRIDSARTLGARSLLGRDRRMHHYLRGLMLVARHEDAAAVEELRRAVTSSVTGYTRINYELGRALLRTGQPREAIRVLQPAILDFEGTGLYITRTEIREALAHAWDAAGGRDSAVAHYRAVAHAWRAADPVLRLRVDSVRARLSALETGLSPRPVSR